MDSFMRTKTCCGCFTPRTGILILAVLSIIFSIWSFIASVMALSSGHYIPVENYGMGRNFWRNQTILKIVSSIVNLILAPLLIIGVNKDKPSLIFPSVCASFIGIALLIPVTFLPFVLPGVNGGVAAITFVILVAILVLTLHWTFVLYHYYKDLVRSQESGGLPKYSSPGVPMNIQ